MVAKHVGRKRLLKLADHLDTVTEKQFKMESWFQSITSEGYSEEISAKGVDELKVDKRPNSDDDTIKPIFIGSQGCGYAACAIGHAYSIKSFRRAGFSLVLNRWNFRTVAPRFDGITGFDAVDAFFAIDDDQSTALFGSDAYDNVHPKVVAQNLRDFVASGA